MNKASSVTIAIACYNQARFLKDAIRSSISQTLSPAEIIVLDDGSTDDTREVVGEFKQVRYLYQKNAGLSAARNACLSIAASSLILFLDADDWLAGDAVRSAVDAFEASGRSLAFVHGGYHEVTAKGAVLSTHLARYETDAFRSLLQGNYIAMHGTVVYDTAVLRASGGFDTTLKFCEDYDVYLRLARQREIGTYPEVAAFYRRHEVSLSRNRLLMIESACQVIDRHFEQSERSDVDLIAAGKGRYAMTDYYVRQIATDLRHSRNRLGTLWKMTSNLFRRPALMLHLARWAIARSTRAATITG